MPDLIATFYKKNDKDPLVFIKFLISFAYSLRMIARYEDDILLLSYSELDPQLLRLLNKYNIDVRFIKSNEFHIHNRRFIDLDGIISELHYDNVIVCDLDIWFQNDLHAFFEIINKTDGFVYTPDIPDPFRGKNSIPYGNRLDSAGDNEILIEKTTRLLEIYNTIPNIGVLGFKKENFALKINDYKQYFQKRNNTDEYGLDTFVLINLFDFERDIVAPSMYNYLAKQKAVHMNGSWHTNDRKLITIMHMAGGSRQVSGECFFWNSYPDIFREIVKELESI